jgi:amino-acid N-acetyltransferase
MPACGPCGGGTMSLTPVTIRPAAAADEDEIRALVKRERLNPRGLDWPNFVVAVADQRIVGAVQLRRHADGARELGSLVVAEYARGRSIATRLINALLAPHGGPVQMITNALHANHYWRWGFQPIAVRQAPRCVQLNYLIGRLARVISFFRGQAPRRLVILERGAVSVRR